LRKFKSPIQDFLAMVLVFKAHIFSRDSLIAFDSYQSEKYRNTRIVNLTVTTIWVRFTWRVLLVRVRFLQTRSASCNVVLTLCFKVFMAPHVLQHIGAVCLFFWTQIRKKHMWFL